MDDMGWCPVCGALADLNKGENSGRCQHCDFYFCLDCKNKVHPYKRCAIHRLDFLMDQKQSSEFDAITAGNKQAEVNLMNLFFKHCCKSCPNPKCSAQIQKVESGCSHM
jgi:hypothetical protein